MRFKASTVFPSTHIRLVAIGHDKFPKRKDLANNPNQAVNHAISSG